MHNKIKKGEGYFVITEEETIHTSILDYIDTISHFGRLEDSGVGLWSYSDATNDLSTNTLIDYKVAKSSLIFYILGDVVNKFELREPIE